MATYGGVSLEVLLEGSSLPLWSRPVTLNRRKIPGSGKEELQSAGLGNWTITVPCRFSTTSDLFSVMAMQGTAKRTLASFLGATYTSDTMLVAMTEPTAIVGSGGTVNSCRATCTFEREA